MIMTKRKFAVAIVGALLSIHASCQNGRTPDAIVTSIAAYGQRASVILRDSQVLVEKATPSIIPADTTAKIQVQFREAAQVGLKLTSALEAFDAISPGDVQARSAAIGGITNIMAELRRYTRVVLVFVGQNAVGEQLLTLYANLETVFTEIQAGIDKWQLSAAK